MRTGFGFAARYQEYLRRLDAQAVLDYYEAENQQFLANRDGETTEVVHSCLLDRVEPHHAHGDANPSACCNLEKKLYTCYGYWGGDLFHLIMKLEHKGSLDAIVPLLDKFLGAATAAPDDFKAEMLAKMAALFGEKGGAYSHELPAYSERVLESWAFYHPYVEERGVDLDTASRMHVGWDEQDNRITFPHFWQHTLVGWQKRSIPARPGQWPGTPNPKPKYQNSSGFPKTETLYNFDAVAQGTEVIVVESPFSVAKAEALGVPGVVCTFGASCSPRQLEMLRPFRRVAVWMDDDTPGRVAERKLVRGLYRHTNVRVVEPDAGLDLADYASAGEIETKLASAVRAVEKLSQWDKEARP